MNSLTHSLFRFDSSKWQNVKRKAEQLIRAEQYTNVIAFYSNPSDNFSYGHLIWSDTSVSMVFFVCVCMTLRLILAQALLSHFHVNFYIIINIKMRKRKRANKRNVFTMSWVTATSSEIKSVRRCIEFLCSLVCALFLLFSIYLSLSSLWLDVCSSSSAQNCSCDRRSFWERITNKINVKQKVWASSVYHIETDKREKNNIIHLCV